ncbi:unnamed protein product [Gordionus sp. m RMFG-2023]|uniref:D-erythrulose reductase-like n=1 Tax=Gordionus sp. m RMFG-2023 TaxID=3053472 RepID=UPI0030E466AB
MEINFKGKNALVTGAGRGIGRDVAKALSLAGAKVYAMSKTEESLLTLSKEDPKINTILSDVTDWENTWSHIEKISPIHLLVNNAGVAKLQRFLEIDKPSIQFQFDVNFNAVVNVSQAVVHYMLQHNLTEGCSIVNVSSQAALVAIPDHSIYSASKAALDALTRCMALELGPKNIRVNSVNPTIVMTDMGKVNWSRDNPLSEKMRQDIPLQRFADVSEIVNAILYLLSDKASIINGISLPLDGGFTIR